MDRRERMSRALPAQLRPTFTSDWEVSHDGMELDRARLDEAGYRLFPWRIDSSNPWWSRPLKFGEIGCTIAHVACWRHAFSLGHRRFTLILEDDVVVVTAFLDRLQDGLVRLDELGGFDFLYLGRYPLEPDSPVIPGLVSPGYSHCSYGYLVTRRALGLMLDARLDQAIVPVDEFLPSLYIDHPRADVRARFPRRLTALAFDPPIVLQLPKDEAGSDTEDSAFVDW